MRWNLRASTVDGTLYGAMVGVGESYLALFALAAGLGEILAGLVSTVPLMAGAVLQLSGPAGVRWLGTYRRWVVACAATQAASFIPLVAMAWTGYVSASLVFLAATIYWGAALACGSAWSTWIMMLVPGRIRARFFSRRARIANLGVLAGLITGGLTLEHLTDEDSGPVFWFAAVFAAGALCRAGSALSLSLQSETGPPDNHRVVRGLELMRRFRHGPDGRFILFMIFMTLGVQIAQPFLIPFMREELGFNYDQVLALVGASFVAKGLAQPLWGLFAHRYGAVHLLWIGGLGIVPLSALWLVSDSFWYLFASQLTAGAAWGAYELASFLLLVETTREQERTSLWATYNLLNSTAMVGGSVIGAKVLGGLGADTHAYSVIFWASLAARLATVLYLIRTHEVLRRPTPVVIGVDAVRPSSGSIDKPILASVVNEDVAAPSGRRRGDPALPHAEVGTRG